MGRKQAYASNYSTNSSHTLMKGKAGFAWSGPPVLSTAGTNERGGDGGKSWLARHSTTMQMG